MKAVGIYLLIGVVCITGCAGREAYPVQSYITGDEKKSCAVLKAEMAQIESEIRKKLPKSNKTGSNILLGAAGCFLIVPWFFMDLKGADKIEVEAFQQRYNSLSLLAQDKGCGVSFAGATVTGVSDGESVAVQCSQCNSSGGDDFKWQMIDGKILCLECFKKLEESEKATELYRNCPVTDYRYDASTGKGTISVDISGKGIEARQWLVQNIGIICSDKNITLEAGKEKQTGARYRVLDEFIKDSILTIEFEAAY